jgi:hypothetical protein
MDSLAKVTKNELENRILSVVTKNKNGFFKPF